MFFLSADARLTDRAPAPPEAARALFGHVLPVACAYADLLVGPGVRRGLVGPGEAERIWDRHLLNCAVVAELVPSQCRLADLGSGAGLPGIVLAIMLPRVQVILVESMARRTTFLQECVDRLGLSNAVVRRARAEDLSGQIVADVVTARAVARLDRLAVLAAGLARPGGLVLAIKGETAAQELEQAQPVLRRLRVSGLEIVSAGAAVMSRPTTIVRFTTRVGPDGTRAHRGAGLGQSESEGKRSR